VALEQVFRGLSPEQTSAADGLAGEVFLYNALDLLMSG
jgi:hypothetical protein